MFTETFGEADSLVDVNRFPFPKFVGAFMVLDVGKDLHGTYRGGFGCAHNPSLG